MGNHRNALVAAVRQELAEARGTARAVLAAAESARGESQRRRQLVREAYATCLTQLAEARDAARRDILGRFRSEARRLTGIVELAATLCAAGAAGAPWRTWTPTWNTGGPDRGASAGLLRIGTIAYDPDGTDRTRVTLPALLPLLDGAHLELGGEQSAVDGIISTVLLRALGTTRPGEVHVTVFDPEQLGGTLAAFGPLGNAGLLSLVGPGGLGALLDGLVEHICRVNETVLAGEYGSLAALTAATPGPRPEPWRLIVLLVDPATAAELPASQRAQLDRIVRTGVGCGVHLVVRGLDLGTQPTVARVGVRDDGTAVSSSIGDLPIRLDAPPPAERIAGFCRAATEHLHAGPPTARLSDLEPEKLWTESSAYGLLAPIGAGPDGALVEVLLDDHRPHALIGGPPGSGRTNLVYAWLASLAARYGPDELAVYLLDGTDSGSFAQCVPGPGEPDWLPQLHLAGINLTGDPEFGLAVLRHLGEELRHRAQAAKRYGVATLAELRTEDPGGQWPRIVAVLDEFPPEAAEVVALLADLARRGPAQGVHLILTTQDPAGAEFLRDAGLPGFQLRLALPKAEGILADGNLAAAVIPRFHAVVNTDAGSASANRIVRLPDAGTQLAAPRADPGPQPVLPESPGHLPPGDPTPGPLPGYQTPGPVHGYPAPGSTRSAWRALQHRLWRERPDGAVPPRWFDGHAVPRLPEAYRPAGQAPDSTARVGCSPGAVLGERVDVPPGPARLRLGRMPGRNLAVLGSRTAEACDVLAAAALSLAAQGPARFSVACLHPAAERAATRLAGELPQADWYDHDTVAGLFDNLVAADIPHYVLGYGFGAAPAYRDRLRALLADGPERRVHVLAWWRSVARLRETLGGAGLDRVGAWVALDVPGPELSPLFPHTGGPAWSPRPRRALFFDRSVHRFPEVIIPYEVHSDPT
ncbi:FtsK/SpoIIIE family protein [Krasilnikovia cinnamomea]|uniref:FtsK/SpoIIIE family protein n=1 Tax=Krasilnikovia cinnamomea TaxID=349313 RepID=A0A4Q7ZGN6_9ACTN|nr:FtsK/SpoIIIE domain-containing protein [Krasilnikovia cinnamomea]RZU49918.1 FtsK/SpoIIIE family protein [Krasilnikovia cinnamomea]